MDIGNKIKELRKAKGITQEALAKYIGVTFQAVSKWENGISLPDITLAPAIAAFFGVSLDELFDHDAKKERENAIQIADRAMEFRYTDPIKAREQLEEGLKLYPSNDILMVNLLYVIPPDESDEIIRIASKITDVTKDDGIKYDALRFMARTYMTMGEEESARMTLDMIPEIYFSRLSEKAKILGGEDSLLAACMEEGVALRNMLDMMMIMADRLAEKGEIKSAICELERAQTVLDVMEAASSWDGVRQDLAEKKNKLVEINDSKNKKQR